MPWTNLSFLDWSFKSTIDDTYFCDGGDQVVIKKKAILTCFQLYDFQTPSKKHFFGHSQTVIFLWPAHFAHVMAFLKFPWRSSPKNRSWNRSSWHTPLTPSGRRQWMEAWQRFESISWVNCRHQQCLMWSSKPLNRVVKTWFILDMPWKYEKSTSALTSERRFGASALQRHHAAEPCKCTPHRHPAGAPATKFQNADMQHFLQYIWSKKPNSFAIWVKRKTNKSKKFGSKTTTHSASNSHGLGVAPGYCLTAPLMAWKHQGRAELEMSGNYIQQVLTMVLSC